jgi:deoxyribonuclease V
MAAARVDPDHTPNWDVSISQAIDLQKRLADQVRTQPLPADARLIAGADVSILKARSQLIAGIVLWDLHERKVVEQVAVRAEAKFPYVPGLLSFREAPAVLEAFSQLRRTPDVALFDGQGIAHPRRFGLACHLGVLLNLPSVGCAKSRLIGTYVEPPKRRGSWTDLVHGDEVIGAVLRTRDNVSPLYISIGHRASLQTSIDLVLRCCTRYRLPEPTRLAHQLVTAEKTRTR